MRLCCGVRLGYNMGLLVCFVGSSLCWVSVSAMLSVGLLINWYLWFCFACMVWLGGV